MFAQNKKVLALNISLPDQTCCLSPVCLCFGAVGGTLLGWTGVACLVFCCLKKCCVVVFVWCVY